MKLRLWPRRSRVEPVAEEVVAELPAEPPALEPAAVLEPTPAAPPEEELPASLTLTLEEAKEAIRAAGGDVIQVGFLGAAYNRARAEDPRSADTAAARRQLSELVAKRLKDRKLIPPDGTFVLREDADA